MVTEVAWVAAVVQVQSLTQELQSALGVAKKKEKAGLFNQGVWFWV